MLTRDAFGRVVDRITCPDCNADREFVEVESHVYVLAMFHDDTCPWMNRKEQS